MTNEKNVSFYMGQELQKYMTPEAKNYALVSWYKHMFGYIPADTFMLASTREFSEDTGEFSEGIKLSPEEAMQIGIEAIKSDPNNVIHFMAPYASVQYDGDNFNFRKDQHSLAQARWGEVAADLHGEEIVQELKDFVKRSEK